MDRMNRKMFWTGGALMGAGLMALFDPDRGKGRRTVLRDKAASAAGAVGKGAGKTWRDLRHRAQGAAARARTLVDRVDRRGDVLAARVRSRLGRLTSHPRAITVAADGSNVTLSGQVLAAEAEAVLAGVRAVPGVEAVEDRLVRYETANGIPALQGGRNSSVTGSARRRSMLPMRESWSPTARLFGAVAGAVLVAAGVRRRGWLGGGMAALGLGLLSRSAANRPMRRLVRLGRSRANIDVRKSVTLAAPVSQVYEFFERWENLPRVFEHVRDVRDEGGGWTRWTVASATGPEIVFDAVVTATIPNHLIAWKTAPRQAVRQSGLVRFEELSPVLTQVDVQMTYTPPPGQLAESVASLFRSDAAASLEDDLLRLKSILETGATAAEAEAEGSRTETRQSEASSSREEAVSFGAAARRDEAEAETGTPSAREDEPIGRPEEAIVAAQDLGVVPLIQEEPGQAEPVHSETPPEGAEGGEAATTERPARRKSRKKRPGPEVTDRVDF